MMTCEHDFYYVVQRHGNQNMLICLNIQYNERGILLIYRENVFNQTCLILTSVMTCSYIHLFYLITDK